MQSAGRTLMCCALVIAPRVGVAQTPVCPPAERSQSSVVVAATADRPGLLRIRAVSIHAAAALPMAEARIVGNGVWQSVVDTATIAPSPVVGSEFVLEVRAIGYGVARATARLAPDSGLVALAVMVPIALRVDEQCILGPADPAGRGSADVVAQVTQRDGPDAWKGYWDAAALVMNDRIVYCPEVAAGDSVPRLSGRFLQQVKPEQVPRIEISRNVPAWVGAVCGTQLTRVVQLQYRGKPPGGGKTRP